MKIKTCYFLHGFVRIIFLIGIFSSSSDKSHKYETVCPFINFTCNYSKENIKIIMFVCLLFFLFYMYKIHCSSVQLFYISET